MNYHKIVVYNHKLLNIFKLYENSIPDDDKERIKFGSFYEIYTFIENYKEKEKKKAEEIINNAIKFKKAKKEFNERFQLKREIMNIRNKLMELENKFNN